MPRRTAQLSVALGAVLLVGAPIAWYLGQPVDTVGEVPVAPPTATGPAPAEPAEPDLGPAGATTEGPTPDPEPAPDRQAEPPEVTVGQLEGPVRTVRPPSEIRIDAIGVDAPVVPVGLEPDGAMEIPEDVATVGWYEPGVRPGQVGTAVLSGHVDSRTQGHGAFFDLRHLVVDDVVTVTDDQGEDRSWRVVARTLYPKDELPIEEIFTRFSEPRLVLITCGGEFDSDTRHYTDNVVVYAEPTDI